MELLTGINFHRSVSPSAALLEGAIMARHDDSLISPTARLLHDGQAGRWQQASPLSSTEGGCLGHRSSAILSCCVTVHAHALAGVQPRPPFFRMTAGFDIQRSERGTGLYL